MIKKEEKQERKEEKRPEDIKKEKDQDELTPGAVSRSRVAKSGGLCLGHWWKGWRHGRGGGDPGRRQPRFVTHWGFFVLYSNNHRSCDRTEVSILQIRHRGMDLYHPAQNCGREIAVKASYDSLANPSQKSQHRVCTRPGGWILGVGTATLEEESRG